MSHRLETTVLVTLLALVAAPAGARARDLFADEDFAPELAPIPTVRAEPASRYREERPRAARDAWGLGPIDLRDAFAISLAHLTLAADSPATTPAGRLDLAVRTDWGQTIHNSDRYDGVLDVETFEIAPIFRYGLTDWLELGIEVPIVYRYEGVLDPFIRRVEERSSGGVRPERRDRPENVFRLEGTTEDARPFKLDRGAGLGKVRLGLEYRFLDGDDLAPAASVELAIGLPTGTQGGFASEGADVGFRLSFSHRVGDLVLYWGGSAVVLGGDLQGIELAPTILTGFGAAEYAFTPWVALVVQAWMSTPSVRNLGDDRTPIIYAGGGVRWARDGRFIEIGLIENFYNLKGSADVAFHLGSGFRF